MKKLSNSNSENIISKEQKCELNNQIMKFKVRLLIKSYTRMLTSFKQIFEIVFHEHYFLRGVVIQEIHDRETNSATICEIQCISFKPPSLLYN